MKKKISWEKQNKEKLKLYHKKIADYYKEIKSNNYDDIILTREYTDFLFKSNLSKHEPHAHLHHIIPRACGGTDDSRNLIWVHLDNHSTAHSILYVANRKNVSIRCAATMLRRWSLKRKHLTAPEDRRMASMSENFSNLYGDSHYQWQED